MTVDPTDALILHHVPTLNNGTMVLSFSGWMDGGDVSTGTVERLVDLLGAKPIGEIDPDRFYLCNFPGSMELTALFRPHIEIKDGLIQNIDLPESIFYHSESSNLILFIGKEPHLGWRSFGKCIFRLCSQVGVTRILFVGSFGGAVPHTREPRLYVTCSEERLLKEMEKFGARRTSYEGPGSFTSYLMTQAPSAGFEMVSLIVEIPGYLQGMNPMSIEAATRRLAKILQLPLDLASLRAASTEWELHISSIVEQDEDLMIKVRAMEEEYDNDLLEQSE